MRILIFGITVTIHFAIANKPGQPILYKWEALSNHNSSSVAKYFIVRMSDCAILYFPFRLSYLVIKPS